MNTFAAEAIELNHNREEIVRIARTEKQLSWENTIRTQMSN
jgi:hypothetical protein